MRDAALRRQKDRWLEPIATRALANVHPNSISAAALVVGLLSALAVWQGVLWLGLLLWIGNRVLDGLDGVVARKYGKQSDFGGYLDLALDYVVYLAIPLAFVALEPSPLRFWGGLLLISSFVLNLVSWSVLSAILEKRGRQALAGQGVRQPEGETPNQTQRQPERQAERQNERQTTVEMPPGLIEGAETIAFYTLFFLLASLVSYLFLLMALLVFFTAAQRIWWAYHHVR
jgi:phosphatidylglycerophosphate synthase